MNGKRMIGNSGPRHKVILFKYMLLTLPTLNLSSFSQNGKRLKRKMVVVSFRNKEMKKIYTK